MSQSDDVALASGRGSSASPGVPAAAVDDSAPQHGPWGVEPPGLPGAPTSLNMSTLDHTTTSENTENGTHGDAGARAAVQDARGAAGGAEEAEEAEEAENDSAASDDGSSDPSSADPSENSSQEAADAAEGGQSQGGAVADDAAPQDNAEERNVEATMASVEAAVIEAETVPGAAGETAASQQSAGIDAEDEDDGENAATKGEMAAAEPKVLAAAETEVEAAATAAAAKPEVDESMWGDEVGGGLDGGRGRTTARVDAALLAALDEATRAVGRRLDAYRQTLDEQHAASGVSQKQLRLTQQLNDAMAEIDKLAAIVGERERDVARLQKEVAENQQLQRGQAEYFEFETQRHAQQCEALIAEKKRLIAQFQGEVQSLRSTLYAMEERIRRDIGGFFTGVKAIVQTLVGVVRKANNQAEMYRSKMLEAEAAAAAAKAALATYQASSAAAAAAATARPTVWSSSTKVPHTPPANKSGVAITAVGATTSPARSSPLAGQPTAAAAAPTSTSIMSPAPKSTSAPAGSGVFLCLSGFKPGLPGYDLEVKAKLSAAANALGVTQLHGAQWDPRITHIIAPPNCRTMKVLASILKGRWLMPAQWLLDSQSAGTLLPEAANGGARLLINPFEKQALAFSKRFLANPRAAEKRQNATIIVCDVSGGTITTVLSEAHRVLVDNTQEITNPERELTWAQFLDLIPDLAGGKPVGKKAASDPGQPQTAVLEETPKPALSTPTAVRGPADLVTPVPMQEAIRPLRLPLGDAGPDPVATPDSGKRKMLSLSRHRPVGVGAADISPVPQQQHVILSPKRVKSS